MVNQYEKINIDVRLKVTRGVERDNALIQNLVRTRFVIKLHVS